MKEVQRALAGELLVAAVLQGAAGGNTYRSIKS